MIMGNWHYINKRFDSIIQYNTNVQLQSIIRPAFVPKTQPVLSLLNEMRSNHQHMSIVLDEYGPPRIVTIEDLLEQIVGDIEDEHDSHHPEYIRQLSSKQYKVNGLTPIDQFNQHFNTQLDITGLILYLESFQKHLDTFQNKEKWWKLNT